MSETSFKLFRCDMIILSLKPILLFFNRANWVLSQMFIHYLRSKYLSWIYEEIDKLLFGFVSPQLQFKTVMVLVISTWIDQK